MEMEKNRIEEFFKQKMDEFLSSEWLQEKIEKFLSSCLSVFTIKAKGEEKVNEVIKEIEARPLPKLIQEYLNAAEEVRKNRKLSPDDKLKKLIPPLSEIQKIIFPNYPKYHQFVDDRYINVKEELDLKNLISDPERYSILGGTEFKELGLLNTRSRNIWLAKESKYSSVSRIYENWLPTLNQEIMKSKDVLTQILVCYAIKRALNGDEAAIQKLCDLYANVAQAIAVKTGMTIAKKMGMKFLDPMTVEEMKQDAKIYLRFLITGFQPKDILTRLLTNENDRIVKALPKWIKTFYIWYLSEYIPQGLKETQMESEALKLMKKGGDAVLWVDLITLLNPYTPIQGTTLWKGTPKRVNRFNSYSYRPNKMGPHRNLTTWLFGVSKYDPRGNLFRLLRDKYESIARKKSKEKSVDFNIDKHDEAGEKSLGFKKRTKAIRAKETSIYKGPEEIIKEIKKYGVTQRDAEIFTKWKFIGVTQQELAKEYNLSERWIRKISRKVEALVQS